jgi:hypothetical protein
LVSDPDKAHGASKKEEIAKSSVDAFVLDISYFSAYGAVPTAIGIEIDSDPDSDLDFAHLTNKKMSKPQVSRSNKSPNGTLIQN